MTTRRKSKTQKRRTTKRRTPVKRRRTTTRRRTVKRTTARRRTKTTARKKVTSSSRRTKTYEVNMQFDFFNELRDLVLKASPTEIKELTRSIHNLGRIKLAVIAGIFLDKESVDPMATDLLIVCDDVSKRKFRTLLKSLEADVGKEIKYAVMEREEFIYRLTMFDRFVRVLFEEPHQILIDRIGIEV